MSKDDPIEAAYKEIIRCQQEVIESLSAIVKAQTETIMKFSGVQS